MLVLPKGKQKNKEVKTMPTVKTLLPQKQADVQLMSAKKGVVPFSYKSFLGYRRGADNQPEIDPEEAEIVRFIFLQL